jgi:hypothetical protein
MSRWRRASAGFWRDLICAVLVALAIGAVIYFVIHGGLA